MEKKLSDFTGQLKAMLGANLISVILYGSKARGEDIKRHSDINILLILNKIDLSALNAVAQIKKKLVFRKMSPLVFSKDYMNNSLDTFPVEFSDIKENHSLLYGEDCLKDLKIDLKNLRHQCEWELKSKIIQLQKFYINSGAKAKALQQFLLKSLPAFAVIFKNIRRLKNIDVESGEDVLSQLRQARISNRRIKDMQGTFEKFLSMLYRLSDAVDRL